MNYKDHYKHLTNESEVPFTSADTIQKGLRAKYGNDELDAYTFGIELEFTPNSDEYDQHYTYDWDERDFHVPTELLLHNTQSFEAH
jgi:hypothetical protein